MNRKGKKIVSTIFVVLRQPFYGSVSIGVTVGLSLLYYYMTLSSVPVFAAVEKLGLLFIAASFTLTFVTAALSGINISLLIFKIKGSRLTTIKGTCASTGFGSALIAFTPGCPACFTPLVAILGTVGGIALFPLQGLEFKIISIVALSFSTYGILKKNLPPDNIVKAKRR